MYFVFSSFLRSIGENGEKWRSLKIEGKGLVKPQVKPQILALGKDFRAFSAP